MTELRKKILTNIYRREKNSIQDDIDLNKDYLEFLKSKIIEFEYEKNVVNKYHIYADEFTLKEFKIVCDEYEKLSIIKKMDFIIGSIYTFYALFSISKGFAIEGYCLVTILNSFMQGISIEKNEIHDSKKYKLVKKSFKKYLKDFNINSSYYDLKQIHQDIDEKRNYTRDDIRNYNNKIKSRKNELEQLKLLLFNSKIEYIDCKLKPVFYNIDSSEYYRSLNNRYSAFLPKSLKKIKIKTLKNQVIIK